VWWYESVIPDMAESVKEERIMVQVSLSKKQTKNKNKTLSLK
jgi:hypothetical protein